MDIKKFPHFIQHDVADCGPTCLRMMAKYYGKEYSAEMLRQHSYITRTGVSMLGISDAAEFIGFAQLVSEFHLSNLQKRLYYLV